jgi:uncharacterized protein YceH (UPF0502 family)
MQRRIAGVLVEKSKTTPDIYPMSLNGIKTAANQKSNRSPKMELQEHEVEDTLYQLRHLGAVVEVHSGGRIPKYKHQLYEWLDVDKAELAVLAELLLRGEQTVGELRARAARMEKSLAGLEELKPVLVSLTEKKLLVELTPAGRGQIVTHNLYEAAELDQLKKQSGSAAIPRERNELPSPAPASSSSPGVAGDSMPVNQLDQLNQKVEALEETVARLQEELTELRRLLD